MELLTSLFVWLVAENGAITTLTNKRLKKKRKIQEERETFHTKGSSSPLRCVGAFALVEECLLCTSVLFLICTHFSLVLVH